MIFIELCWNYVFGSLFQRLVFLLRFFLHELRTAAPHSSVKRLCCLCGRNVDLKRFTTHIDLDCQYRWILRRNEKRSAGHCCGARRGSWWPVMHHELTLLVLLCLLHHVLPHGFCYYSLARGLIVASPIPNIGKFVEN